MKTKMLIDKSSLSAELQQKLNGDDRVRVLESNPSKVVVEVEESDISVIKRLYNGLADLSEG